MGRMPKGVKPSMSKPEEAMSQTHEFDPEGREREHLKAHLRWALSTLRKSHRFSESCPGCYSGNDCKPDCPYQAAQEAAK
jgi:hypothetical protein